MTHDEIEAEHEAWILAQALACTACEEPATTVMRWTSGVYTMLGSSYCDACATDIRERYGSTRQKRVRHEFAERARTAEDVESVAGRLRERFPVAYRSTVGEVS